MGEGRARPSSSWRLENLYPYGWLFTPGHDGQQHKSFTPHAKVQRGLAAENRGRPVARIIVQERSAPAQFILEIGEPRTGGFGELVIAPAHGQCDAMTRGHD